MSNQITNGKKTNQMNKSNENQNKRWKSKEKSIEICNFCLKTKRLPENECRGHTINNCKVLENQICHNCEHLGHTKEYCKTKICYFCLHTKKFSKYESSGHDISNCPNLGEEICIKCKLKGHTVKYCQSSRCKMCNKYGHSRDNCYLVIEHKCIYCGQIGHLDNWCETYCSRCDGYIDSKTGNKCNGLVGHISRKCPYRICSFCGENDHVEINCYYRQNKSKYSKQKNKLVMIN